jgi:hypothetical protein
MSEVSLEELVKIIKYPSHEILPLGMQQECLCSHTQRTIYSYGNNCIGKQHSSFCALSRYVICFCFKLNIADYASLIKVRFVLSFILLTTPY